MNKGLIKDKGLQLPTRRTSLSVQSNLPGGNTDFVGEVTTLKGESPISKKMAPELQEFLKDIKQTLQANTDAVKQLTLEMRDVAKRLSNLEDNSKKSQEELKEIKKRLDNDEKEFDLFKDDLARMEDQLAINDYYRRSLNLKIRGLDDQDDCDIRTIVTEMLAKALNVQATVLGKDLEQIYWVNSAYAKTNKLPRDCLVKFTNRDLRDQVLKAHFQTPIALGDRKVEIFKDVPARLLKKRRDFKQLTDILRKNQILFRWEIPVGVSFFFKGRKVLISDSQKMNNFFRKYKKELEG